MNTIKEIRGKYRESLTPTDEKYGNDQIDINDIEKILISKKPEDHIQPFDDSVTYNSEGYVFKIYLNDKKKTEHWLNNEKNAKRILKKFLKHNFIEL